MFQIKCSDTPLFQRVANAFSAYILSHKIPLLSSVFIGLLAYGFTFTNKLPNHDDVISLFGKGGTYAFGRWGLQITEKIFPNFSMPWIYGILTILLIGFSVCLMIDIFRIQNRLLQGLLAGCVVAFPSLSATFTYMFTASSYGVAFLLSVLAVYFLQKKRFFPVFIAIGCLVLSLSIYQAYVSITAGILVLVLIQELLEGKDLPGIIRKGFLFVGYLAVSLVLYYISFHLICRLKNIQLVDNAVSQFQLSEFFNLIQWIYGDFRRFFVDGFQGLAPTPLSRYLHILSAIAVCILCVVWTLHQKNGSTPPAFAVCCFDCPASHDRKLHVHHIDALGCAHIGFIWFYRCLYPGSFNRGYLLSDPKPVRPHGTQLPDVLSLRYYSD